ncbi:MAG: DUF411 domain-containing protein [Rubrivivax sp.]|nr:DUF411 domain-containing protein [Rubrivivax sp.]
MMNPIRRRLLGATAAMLALPATARTAPPLVQVWKDVSCGCCHDWIDHLKANGFAVRAYDEGNTAARHRLGVPAKFGSCHTALVDGYAIEGHVPASDIRRLLRERPKAVGLVVPGMPIGSPGMDTPAYGGRRDAYSVLLLGADGSTTVYASYGARAPG